MDTPLSNSSARLMQMRIRGQQPACPTRVLSVPIFIRAGWAEGTSNAPATKRARDLQKAQQSTRFSLQAFTSLKG